MGIIRYNVVRKIHLYTAFTLLGFVAMYFVTGFILTHEQWFSGAQPTVTTQTYPLRIPKDTLPEELAIHLQEMFGIRAKRLKPEQKKDGRLVLAYVKPGRHYQITVSPDRTSATLRLEKQTLYRALVVFHRLHGYGDGWPYDLYVWMMDLASIACLLFSITGIYLWYQFIQRKTWGVVLLCLSIGYTMTVIYLFMNA